MTKKYDNTNDYRNFFNLQVSNSRDVELLKAKRLIERVRFLSKEIFLAGENRRYS